MLAKCECGTSYVAGDPEEEERHCINHEIYLNGPRLSILSTEKEVGKVKSYIVVRVLDDSMKSVRSAAVELARAANFSTPDYAIGYDGSKGHGLIVYALICGERAIGYLLIKRTQCYCSLRWSGREKARLISNKAKTDERVLVARIWIAKNYQRKGLARRFIEVMSKIENQNVSDMVYQLPFTDTGRCLVKALAPDEWYGDGDIFDFTDILEK